VLASLADKSLIAWQGDGIESRASMLETIREYALERLTASGEAVEIRRAHAAYFRGLAERAEPDLSGPSQGIWLDRLEADHANLRDALGWALDRGEPETALRLGGSLSLFWRLRGHLTEGRVLLARVLAQGGVEGAARARALRGAGGLAALQGDRTQAVAHFEAALTIWRSLGDAREIAKTLGNLNSLALEANEYERALRLAEEARSLFESIGDQGGIADVFNRLGMLADVQGQPEQAAAYYERSLALHRTVGNELEVGRVLSNLGVLAFYQQRFEEARDLYAESLAITRRFGDKRHMANALMNLGEVLRFLGELDRAGELAAEAVACTREMVDRHTLAAALYVHGSVMQARGERRQAVDELTEAVSLYQETGDRLGLAWCFEGLAALAWGSGQPDRSARLIGLASRLRELIRSPARPSEQATIQTTTASVRNALGAASFADAWETGRALTVDAALAEAGRIPDSTH
jgi:tetratricopeptide (TPR) repeat protein